MEHHSTRGRPPTGRRSRAGFTVSLTLALAAATAVAGIQAATDTQRRVHSGKASLRHAAAVSANGIFIAGNQLTSTGNTGGVSATGVKPNATLAAPALSPLAGGADPVGALSPDGQALAYNTWSWIKNIDWSKPLDKQGIQTGDVLGTPDIHVLNLATGADKALEPGSFSVAWRADGALAYAVGSPKDYRWSQEYDRSVVVRSGSGPVAWTTPGLYRVEAWAGSALIVARDTPLAPSELDVLTGPRQMRQLVVGADLLAVSPTGDTVLVSESPKDTPNPRIRLLRVADGVELASMPLAQVVDPVTSAAVTWVGGPADWKGTHIVVAAETGLVFLTVSGSTLALEQVLHLDAATHAEGMLYEPRFTDADATKVVAWTDVPAPPGQAWSSAQLVCDRVQLACVEADPVAATQQPRPVYDRSGGQ